MIGYAFSFPQKISGSSDSDSEDCVRNPFGITRASLSQFEGQQEKTFDPFLAQKEFLRRNQELQCIERLTFPQPPAPLPVPPKQFLPVIEKFDFPATLPATTTSSPVLIRPKSTKRFPAPPPPLPVQDLQIRDWRSSSWGNTNDDVITDAPYPEPPQYYLRKKPIHISVVQVP